MNTASTWRERSGAPEGAVRGRMRVGRGTGSGKGKTAGKGQKGQLARGHLKKLGFRIKRHSHEIYGNCADCVAAETN